MDVEDQLSLVFVLLGATGLALADYRKQPALDKRFGLHWLLTVIAFLMFWLKGHAHQYIWKDA